MQVELRHKPSVKPANASSYSRKRSKIKVTDQREEPKRNQRAIHYTSIESTISSLIARTMLGRGCISSSLSMS